MMFGPRGLAVRCAAIEGTRCSLFIHAAAGVTRCRSHMKPPRLFLAIGTIAIALVALLALVAAVFQVSAMQSANRLAEKNQERETARINKTAEQALEASKAEFARISKARAVDLILHWTRTLSSEMMLARKVGLAIKPGDEINLVQYKQLCIKEEGEIFLKALFPHASHTKMSEFILVPPDEIVVIRTLLIKYLNTLEGIMVAWERTAVDREILEQEFTYFVLGNGALDAVRAAFDESFESSISPSKQIAYPSIDKFVRAVRSQYDPEPTPQKKQRSARPQLDRSLVTTDKGRFHARSPYTQRNFYAAR